MPWKQTKSNQNALHISDSALKQIQGLSAYYLFILNI